ncbi:hypothetical protein [Prochlorococcus sp. MIT 1307]|uniref:hypothetical protein n=1 Tax=Prochlorococcus sp. MIT 1307 TaxID=3096219 RepID=UPI002A75F2ED|nr:hypothetical protein [Prochlorococcus sp. MIT 1307]
MESKTLSVNAKVQLLVDRLDGDKAKNDALSSCKDGEDMLNLLIETSTQMNLDLTRDDFLKTPPIRDWIWWKNKDAPLTLGDGVLRYQQDKNSKNRRFIGMGALIILLFIVGMVAGF